MQQKVNFAAFVIEDKVIFFNFKVALILLSVILFSCSSLYSYHLYEVQKKKYELRYLTEKKQNLDKRIVSLSSQIATRTQQIQQIKKKSNQAQEEMRLHQGAITEYMQAKLRPRLFANVLSILSNHASQEVWLTQFHLDLNGYHYTLEGRAKSVDLLRDYVKNLSVEKTPGMDGIKIIHIEQIRDDLIQFKVASS